MLGTELQMTGFVGQNMATRRGGVVEGRLGEHLESGGSLPMGGLLGILVAGMERRLLLDLWNGVCGVVDF